MHYSFMLEPFSAEKNRASLKTTMCSLCIVSCDVGSEIKGALIAISYKI